jgi:excisionase family DNA binding protein
MKLPIPDTTLPDPLLMDVPTAARFIGLGERTMWRLVKAKEVPHIRIGRRVLFMREWLQNWLKEGVSA